MAGKSVNVVLDTNIIISSIGFGGKPRDILTFVLEKRINAVSSPVLLAELEDIIFKKFPLLTVEFKKIDRQIRKKFRIVEPQKSLHILQDEPDNRVLEAAVEGKCHYIVTGDKELLTLGSFRNISIITASKFLKIMKLPRAYARGIFSPRFVGSKIPPKRKLLRVHPRAYARGFSRRGIKQ